MKIFRKDSNHSSHSRASSSKGSISSTTGSLLSSKNSLSSKASTLPSDTDAVSNAFEPYPLPVHPAWRQDGAPDAKTLAQDARVCLPVLQRLGSLRPGRPALAASAPQPPRRCSL
jgi:hypothetical protein